MGPEESVFLGDRVYTDYAMARNCGARVIGVLSGEATRQDFEACEDIIVVPTVGSIFV